MLHDDPGALHRRIQELEDRLEQLRISRRVLLYLIEKSEADKNRLLREKEELQIKNKRYAQALWRKNKEILLLENKLRQEITS